MISICTKCGTNYNVDESRIKGGRVLLRCQVCNHWFSVAVAPESSEKTDESQTGAEQSVPVSKPTEVESQSQQTASEHHEPVAEPAKETETGGTKTEAATPLTETEQSVAGVKPAYLKLLVADTPNQFRSRVVKTLNDIDPTLELVVVDDGGLAMGALAGFAPDLAIIGTAIEKVYCFEICDYMRAKERLKDATIIFAAELHAAAWNCAEPESLYGADTWISNAASDDELFAGLSNHLETLRSAN
jgi:predicted Zn finger-like uncharacterized protein